MDLIVEGGTPLRGEVRLPADKSILHRALICAGIAAGKSRIGAAHPGEDNLSTAVVLRGLGVGVTREADGFVVDSQGAAAWRTPAEPLDCGNSGTTMRLMAGALCGAGVAAVLTGDDSLRRRPMRRVCEPLRALGGQLTGCEEGGKELPPLHIERSAGTVDISDPPHFAGGAYRTTVASAQVKSALLLAGVCSGRAVEITEPSRSRDHSERQLAAMGAVIDCREGEGGNRVRLAANAVLTPGDLVVPGDISSAAFLIAAALLVDGSEIEIHDVGLNATRTGLLEILEEIGGGVRVSNWREVAGEPVGTVTACSRHLVATRYGDVPTVIGGEVIPRLIDELVVLAAVASQAEGRTEIRDAAELRVKESDRIAETARLLAAFGVTVEEQPSGMVIEGPQALRSADLDVSGDHRIALCAAVLALAAPGESRLRGFEIAAVSFPRIFETLTALGARVRVDA